MKRFNIKSLASLIAMIGLFFGNGLNAQLKKQVIPRGFAPCENWMGQSSSLGNQAWIDQMALGGTVFTSEDPSSLLIIKEGEWEDQESMEDELESGLRINGQLLLPGKSVRNTLPGTAQIAFSGMVNGKYIHISHAGSVNADGEGFSYLLISTDQQALARQETRVLAAAMVASGKNNPIFALK